MFTLKCFLIWTYDINTNMSNSGFNKDQEVRRYFENVFKAYEALSKNVLFMQKSSYFI